MGDRAAYLQVISTSSLYLVTVGIAKSTKGGVHLVAQQHTSSTEAHIGPYGIFWRILVAEIEPC